MTWPTPQDYAEAIQNPRSSFSDPDLRRSRPELTPLGLPRPITGNFASVYKMSLDGRAVAVRCFFREFGDMRERYAAISRSLETAKLPYTVGFSYVGDGISVRRAHYPVLKMEWAEGLLLDEYIRQNLHDGTALRDLANSWKELAARLGTAGVAHGDLQHGNVLCHQGRLLLVDYDGMFVPGLRGKRSHELGHPNYQHPARTSTHFGPSLDHFSLWVIYASILALSVEPELWTRLDAGDERLLFSRADFANPATSIAFSALTRHPDGAVRAAAETVRSGLRKSVEGVPSLECLTSSRPLRRSRSSRSVRAAGRTASLPYWLAGQVKPVVAASLEDPGLFPRLCLVGVATILTADLLPTAGLLTSSGARAWVAAGALFGAGLTIAFSYLHDGSARVRLRLVGLRALGTVQFRAREWRLGAMELRVEGTQDDRDRVRAYAAMAKGEESALQERRRTKVQTQLRQLLDVLNPLLKDARDAREKALKDEWKRYQKQIVDRELRRRSILTARIPGVSGLTRLRLWLQGIRTAAEIDAAHAARLDELPRREAAALLKWRHTDIPQGPTALPAHLQAAATRRVDREIARLEHLRKAVLAAAAPVLSALREWETQNLTVLDARESKQLLDLETRATRLQEETERLSALLAAAELRLDSIEAALEPYRKARLSNFIGLLLLGRRRPALIRDWLG